MKTINELKDKIGIYAGALTAAIKNKQFKKWLYEFKNGHPFLAKEESDIICEVRFDERFVMFNDAQIQRFIKARVKTMYKEKFPNARRWSLPVF